MSISSRKPFVAVHVGDSMRGKRRVLMNRAEAKLSPETVARIEDYRDFFAAEMIEAARHLREFKVNKEEFYRR